MTWMSGPCVSPDDQPTPEVRAIHRAIHEAQIVADVEDGEPGPSAAHWPGHEIDVENDES